MRRLIRALLRSTYALPVVIGVLQAAPAEAVPVVGTFTFSIFDVNPGSPFVPPFFGEEGDVLTGRFGYDTDAAVDAEPDPTGGV